MITIIIVFTLGITLVHGELTRLCPTENFTMCVVETMGCKISTLNTLTDLEQCINQYRNELCKIKKVYLGYTECVNNCRPSCFEFLTKTQRECTPTCIAGCECLDGYFREGVYCVPEKFCEELYSGMGSRKIWTQLEQLQRKRDIFIKLELAKPPFPKHFFQDTPGVIQTGYYKNSTINGTAGNGTSTSVAPAGGSPTATPTSAVSDNNAASSSAITANDREASINSVEPSTAVEPSAPADPTSEATSEMPAATEV